MKFKNKQGVVIVVNSEQHIDLYKKDPNYTEIKENKEEKPKNK